MEDEKMIKVYVTYNDNPQVIIYSDDQVKDAIRTVCLCAKGRYKGCHNYYSWYCDSKNIDEYMTYKINKQLNDYRRSYNERKNKEKIIQGR